MRFGKLATHAQDFEFFISDKYNVDKGRSGVGLDWYRLSMMVTSMQIQKTYALTFLSSGRSI